MEEIKKCYRCKKSLDGLDQDKKRCSSCKEYYTNYYKTHRKQEIDRAKTNLSKDREKTNKYKRELHRRNPLSKLLQQARARAKEKKIPFDISIQDLKIPSVCPILGILLKVNDGHAKDNSISIDRIVPELGYVRGNVEIISHKANSIKNNATVEELEKVLVWMRNKNI